eukprot:scaffold83807_cov57-Phaeocystis_antarctica.AAC.3
MEGSPLQLPPKEVSPLQQRATEVGPLQLRLLEVHTAHDRTLQIKRAVGATQPLDVSRFPAAQIKPLHRVKNAVIVVVVVLFHCRLDGATRLLLLARRALAHAHLAHAVHRAHDHRAHAARAPNAAPAAHVRVVSHFGQLGPLQPRPVEVGPLHLRPSEVSPLQICPPEVHTAQYRTLQIKRAVGATQPLDGSRFPAAQIKPLPRFAIPTTGIQTPPTSKHLILCRLDGATRLLLLARRALAQAHLAHAVHRAHDHRVRPVCVIPRAHAARAPNAAPAAHVRVVRHLGQPGPLQVRHKEVGLLQLCPTEVGPLQLRHHEVHTAQNRTLQLKRAVGAAQPLDVSRFPAAQIKPLHQRAAPIQRCRLNGAILFLLLARRALAHAHLAQHAVHRAHDHRALAARASVAAPAAHVRVVRHLGRRGPRRCGRRRLHLCRRQRGVFFCGVALRELTVSARARGRWHHAR